MKKSFFILIAIFLSSCSLSRNYKPLPLTKPDSPVFKDVNVVLVLGGGGAKGIAHVGVIDVLEKNNIPIDLIVGTSAGSVVGAFYASSKDVNFTRKKLINVSKWDVLDISIIGALSAPFSLEGPVTGYKLEKFLYENLPSEDFKDLKIPLVVVSADVKSNEPYILDSGAIPPAVVSSSSIPALFSVAKLYGHNLTDGGAIYPVPVEIAKKYNPKIIIAVNICSPPTLGMPKNAADLSYRSYWMSYYKLCQMQSSQADISIEPDLYGFGIFDDSKNNELYQKGKEAGLAAIPKIKAKLKAIAAKASFR